MVFVGQVVLFLDKVHDKKLRSLASSVYKKKKGSMAKVVTAGIDLVEEKLKRSTALRKLIKMSENAKDLGIGHFNREEAYER